MGANAAGRVFWMFFLLPFPLTVHLSAAGCVNYKHSTTEVCGLKGSSVQFPRPYCLNVQNISQCEWSRKWDHKLNSKVLAKKQAYLSRMKYKNSRNRRKDCTMWFTNLTEEDASLYYFRCKFRDLSGEHTTCDGNPRVRLHVFASPVIILLEEIVGRQKVPLMDCSVIEGKTITLTCVPTCAASLTYNHGYIWYKNRVQMTGSEGNLPALSLNPVSTKDTGIYGCAMINYKDFPSPLVSLKVQTRPRNNTVSIDTGNNRPTMDSLPAPKTSKDKSLFAFSIILAASVCVGWIITITVSILVFKAKKRRRSVSSLPGIPNTSADTYMAMDITSMSHEYDTLDTVRCFFTDETVYEN